MHFKNFATDIELNNFLLNRCTKQIALFGSFDNTKMHQLCYPNINRSKNRLLTNQFSLQIKQNQK